MMLRMRRPSRRASPCVSAAGGRLHAFVSARTQAFSLAELMIALAILGFGLLIIGASLPIAMRYTKETIDRDTGAAACESAFGLLEQVLTIPRKVRDPSVAGAAAYDYVVRPSPVFVPRKDPATSPNADFDATHTPLLKVRALLTQNIAASATPTNLATSVGWQWGNEYPLQSNIPFFVESLVTTWVSTASGIGSGDANWSLEIDRDFPVAFMRPSISSSALAFPSIGGLQDYQPKNFYDAFPQAMYAARTPAGEAYLDVAKRVMAERIHWTAFYRRASYERGSDPLLYEVIVVATRKPSERHRYPIETPTTGGQGSDPPSSDYYWGMDTAAPIPWLVAFSSDDPSYLPTLQPGADYDNTIPERPLKPGFKPPATLRFVAGLAVGSLMPPGSIFIPAVNDAPPSLDPDQQISGGFVPAMRSTAPIYEVVERVWNESLDGGHYEIIVKNNGAYPWVNQNRTAQDWPVWVIPPAIEEVEGSPAEPVFGSQSPVIAVERRFMRLREVP